MRKTLIVGLLLLSLPALLSAFTLNGRKWFSAPSFYINPANGPSCCLTASQQQSALQGGLNSWGILSYGGSTSISGARADGVNVISWDRLGGTTLGMTSYITTDQGQSQVCNGTTIYKFVEVDVRFNNTTKWQTSSSCTNGIDLSGVAVHEYGHCAGLGHSSVSSATMYYAVAYCDFSRASLENDDRAGYSYIYSGCDGGGGGGKPHGGRK